MHRKRRLPFMDSGVDPRKEWLKKISQKRQINTNDPNQNAKKNRVEPHPSKIRTFKSWGNVANEVIFVQLESVGDEREIKHIGAISKIMAENFSKHKLWHSLWDRNYEPKNLQGYQIHTRAHTHTHTFRHSIQIFKQERRCAHFTAHTLKLRRCRSAWSLPRITWKFNTT